MSFVFLNDRNKTRLSLERALYYYQSITDSDNDQYEIDEDTSEDELAELNF